MKADIIYSYIDEIANRLNDPVTYGAASLMVGAGFSKNAVCLGDIQKLPPDWHELAQKMYDELYPRDDLKNYDKKIEECSGRNVLTLAQKYEVAFDRHSLNRFIEHNIADDMYAPGNLHKDLLQLGWNDVFTTNYDTLLERASKEIASKRSYRIVCSQKDLPGSVRPRIVKLHGTVGHSDNYIINEEDYRTYPVKYAPFVNTVQQSMLENRLCLLGFSGDDPNFLSWLGWIRDNLGENCPVIYMCGVFEKLDITERRLLENRNIVLVDLAALLEDSDSMSGVNRYYIAIQKFLELLKDKSSKRLNKVLENKPYWGVPALKSDQDQIALQKYVKEMRAYSDRILDEIRRYVCVPADLKSSIDAYFDFQLCELLTQDSGECDGDLLDKYCEILRRCNDPIYDNEKNKLLKILKSIDSGIFVNIGLYLLQMYRMDGNLTDYADLQKHYEYNMQNYSVTVKNDFCIEFAKECLACMDFTSADKYIEEINDLGNEEYAIKKAFLLVQVGKRTRAENAIKNIASDIAQKRYSENKLASLRGYLNLAARYICKTQNSMDSFTDQDYWGNEFNTRKIVSDSHDNVIKVWFTTQEEQNVRIPAFNPNSYIITNVSGNTNKDKRETAFFKFLLLQDQLCLPVFGDQKDAVAMAAEMLEDTSDSPLWKWYKIFSIYNEKIIDKYFAKDHIYATDAEYVNIFFDRLVKLSDILNKNIGIDNRKIMFKSALHTLTQLSVFVDDGRITTVVSLLVNWDETYSDSSSDETFTKKMLDRLKYSFNCQIVVSCFPYIIQNKLSKHNFMRCFNDIDMSNLSLDNDQKSKLQLNVSDGLASEDPWIRNAAVVKYHIFSKFLNKNIKLEERLWEKTDEWGLPKNKTYLPIVWLDAGETAEDKIVQYLFEPAIEKRVFKHGFYGYGNSPVNKLKDYYICLYQSTKNDRVRKKLEKKGLDKIVNWFYEYIQNEKELLSGKNIVMNTDDTRQSFITINNIVLLICIYAKRDALISREFNEMIEKYLFQIEALNVPCMGIREILIGADYKREAEAIEEIFITGSEELFSSAFIELYGLLIVANDNQGECQEVAAVVMRLINKIPNMEIDISKRILLELSNFVNNVILSNTKYVEEFVAVLSRCYDIYLNIDKKRVKQGLDGMYNVSNLTRTLYQALIKQKKGISGELKELIEKIKKNKLNEVRRVWLG